MNKIISLISLLLVFSFSVNAQAHCQIPCGIYDDNARFNEMLEHTETIEKSMAKINTDNLSAHDISRWTFNKEEHAQKIQDIASKYFLAQRVKTPESGLGSDEYKNYQKHTTLLHQIIVAAMKTKQTTDIENAKKLRALIEEYKEHYVKNHAH